MNIPADKAKKDESGITDNPTPLQIELSLKIWLDSLERGGGKRKQPNKPTER